MARYYVYIIEAADGRYYTGWTTDLDRRLREHQRGRGAKFLRGFGVKRLRYAESLRSRSAALRREAHIKTLSRAGKIALIRTSRKQQRRACWLAGAAS